MAAAMAARSPARDGMVSKPPASPQRRPGSGPPRGVGRAPGAGNGELGDLEQLVQEMGTALGQSLWLELIGRGHHARELPVTLPAP